METGFSDGRQDLTTGRTTQEQMPSGPPIYITNYILYNLIDSTSLFSLGIWISSCFVCMSCVMWYCCGQKWRRSQRKLSCFRRCNHRFTFCTFSLRFRRYNRPLTFCTWLSSFRWSFFASLRWVRGPKGVALGWSSPPRGPDDRKKKLPPMYFWSRHALQPRLDFDDVRVVQGFACTLCLFQLPQLASQVLRCVRVVRVPFYRISPISPTRPRCSPAGSWRAFWARAQTQLLIGTLISTAPLTISGRGHPLHDQHHLHLFC